MAFNLSGLTKMFSFSGNSSPSVLGIDIGSSAIKVVQLKKKNGRAVLETYGEIALGPYAGVEIGRATNLQPEKIGEALLDVIKESKVNTTDCGMSIPIGSSLISFIKMPSVGEKQLAQMIPIEARKYIPVPISEVVLDWSIIPKEDVVTYELSQGSIASSEGGQLDILLVVIHNDAISKNKIIASSASVSPTFFEIETFSSMRSSLDQGIAPVMIFDMGAASTKLYIVERGILRNSHVVNRGSQDITTAISTSLGISLQEAEKMKREIGLSKDPSNKQISDIISLNLDYIFAETNRAILSYQKRYNRVIGKVILSGGGSLLKGLKDAAKDNFSTSVELADPFVKVEAPAFLSGVLANAGPEFATAVGIALRKLQELS